MKVIIFFTYGISLKDWKDTGLLDREIRLYEYLIENFNLDITFVTFGNQYDEEILDNENIKVVPIYKYFKKSKNTLFEVFKSVLYPIRLKNKISFQNNVLKTNQLWGAWIPIVVKIVYKTPLIVRTGYDLITFKQKENKSKFKIKLYKFLTYAGLKYSDNYIVTSEADKIFLKETFRKHTEKITVVPNWVETKFTSNKKRFEDKIVSVGRLEKQKNFKHLIAAFGNENIVLDIYGDGSEKENLISFSEEKTLSVNFHGNIENIKLRETLTQYKYFCTSTMFEGNPKAILEAMAAGCVVIAPNVLGVNTIIKNEKNGFLYDPKNSNPYKIYKKIKNTDTSSISTNAIKYVQENHSIEKLAEKEFNIYNHLL